MDVTLTDFLRVGLPIGGLALTIFAVGAVADRAWTNPRWIVGTAYAAWLMVLGGGIMLGLIPGMEWVSWLAFAASGLALGAVQLRLRGIGRRGPSGG